VIGAPPLVAGACHVNTTDLLSAAAVRFCGALGRRADGLGGE
jgi:hypothetical protein